MPVGERERGSVRFWRSSSTAFWKEARESLVQLGNTLAAAPAVISRAVRPHFINMTGIDFDVYRCLHPKYKKQLGLTGTGDGKNDCAVDRGHCWLPSVSTSNFKLRRDAEPGAPLTAPLGRGSNHSRTRVAHYRQDEWVTIRTQGSTFGLEALPLDALEHFPTG